MSLNSGSVLEGLAKKQQLFGSENETASVVKQTMSGGYIVAGHSESNDGDLGGNLGSLDS